MKRKRIISYLRIFTVLLACLWGLVGLRYSAKFQEIEGEIDQEVSAYLALLEGDVETDFLQHEQDLVLLRDLTEILLADGMGVEEKKELTALYTSFSKVTHAYAQVRFLNGQGLEQVRINWDDQGPWVVDEVELQDKSDRYYVKAMSQLSDQEAYYSPLDLNMEHGAYEEPYQSMFRAGLRVQSPEGALWGYVLLNVRALDWLHEESRSLAPYMDEVVDLSQLRIVNMDGYYIHHEDSDKEWGHLLPGRQGETLAADLPQVWAGRTDQAVFKWTDGATSFYLKKIKSFVSNEPVFGSPVDMGYFLYELPEDRHDALLWDVRREMWLLGLASLLTAGLGAAALRQVLQERRRKWRDLHHRASRDALTGLLNKPGFLESFPTHMKRWDDGIFAMGYFDIDNFKDINDTYGHGAGDELLKEVGRRLREVLRDRDLCARIHGDEFNMLLALREEVDAQVVARRLMKHMKEPIQTSAGEIQVTVSLGIAFFHEGERFEAVAERADRLMYQVKRSGKSDYIIEGLAPEA